MSTKNPKKTKNNKQKIIVRNFEKFRQISTTTNTIKMKLIETCDTRLVAKQNKTIAN